MSKFTTSKMPYRMAYMPARSFCPGKIRQSSKNYMKPFERNIVRMEDQKN
jgi:hypothetical protein